MRYEKALLVRVRKLRVDGLTYKEIQENIGINIPKASLSYICKDILLTPTQLNRIRKIQQTDLARRQKLAVLRNKSIFDEKIAGYRAKHTSMAEIFNDKQVQLIALAMLYLGEGSKWKSRRGPLLASTDPNIIKLYIYLLRSCYNIRSTQLRCRVQQRADQNQQQLIDYWSGITGIDAKRFYKSYVDKRTIGHATLKPNYKGVCSVSCAGTYIQLELEQIAAIIFGVI